MKTSTQYREFAEDCVRLAKQTKTEEERKILQEMADVWRKLAEDADKQSSKT